MSACNVNDAAHSPSILNMKPLLALLLLFASSCHAVMLSSTGMGQALIYPYYTVHNIPDRGTAFSTLISVANQTLDAKVLRVRVLEAKAGASVFEANVFLGPRDVWTAAITPVATGAAISTADLSCTLPLMRSGVADVPGAPFLFDPSRYQGDGLGDDLARVQEGYVEVLELGTIPAGALQNQVVFIGRPPSCLLPDAGAISAALTAPSGGLYGSGVLINVAAGTAYGYDAVALETWRDTPTYSAPGEAAPTLASASPPVSSVLANGRLYISRWGSGADAVNAALMVDGLEGEYMIEPVVAGATDWVVTMPTKRTAVTASTALAPFGQVRGSTGGCEAGLDQMFDRETRLATHPSALGDVHSAGFCGAVSVLPLHARSAQPVSATSQALGSATLVVDLETSSAGRTVESGATDFTHGSGYVQFSSRSANAKLTNIGDTTVTDTATANISFANTATYRGLPAVGIAMTRYVNGQLTVNGANVLANYGVVSKLKRVVNVTSP